MHQCQHCDKTFATDLGLKKHKCRIIERLRFLSTPKGYKVYDAYSKWQTLNHRPTSDPKIFAGSRYFTLFKNITAHLENVRIYCLDLFLQFVKEQNLPITLWTQSTVYSLFIEYVDTGAPPLKLTEVSVKYILKWCEKEGIDCKDFFDTIRTNELLDLIRGRILTPWFVLNSRKFKQKIQRSTSEQRRIFAMIVKLMYWKVMFDENAAEVERIVAIVEEMGL